MCENHESENTQKLEGWNHVTCLSMTWKRLHQITHRMGGCFANNWLSAGSTSVLYACAYGHGSKKYLKHFGRKTRQHEAAIVVGGGVNIKNPFKIDYQL